MANAPGALHAPPVAGMCLETCVGMNADLLVLHFLELGVNHVVALGLLGLLAAMLVHAALATGVGVKRPAAAGRAVFGDVLMQS